MASLYRDIVVEAPLAEVWRALSDVGNAADLFPGILTASEMRNAQERVVTFSKNWWWSSGYWRWIRSTTGWPTPQFPRNSTITALRCN